MSIYHPSRGGVRGGQDQFKWEDVKTDKHRENYLGHSVKASTGRWQKNKDLHWFDKVDDRSSQIERAKIADEIKQIQEQERILMEEKLGIRKRTERRAIDAIDKAELKDILTRGKDDTDDNYVERKEGLGHAPTNRHEGVMFQGQALLDHMTPVALPETQQVRGSNSNDNREKLSKSERKKLKKEQKRKRKEEKKQKKKEKKKEKKRKKKEEKKIAKKAEKERKRLAKEKKHIDREIKKTKEKKRSLHHRSSESRSPKRRRHDSPSSSPPRRTRHDSSSRSNSPKRRRHDSPSSSPPRRRRHDSRSRSRSSEDRQRHDFRSSRHQKKRRD